MTATYLLLVWATFSLSVLHVLLDALHADQPGTWRDRLAAWFAPDNDERPPDTPLH